LSWEHLMIF